MSGRRVALVLVCVTALLIGIAGRAPASAASRHTRYRAVPDEQVLTTGVYTLRGRLEAENPAFTVTDEATGAVSTIPAAPGCAGPGGDLIGGGNLLIDCGGTAETFALPDGPWRAAALSPFCNQAAFGEPPGQCLVDRVGRDWLQFEVSCYHCETEIAYENLSTGVVAGPAGAARQVVDMSAPGLYRPLCPPIEKLPGATTVFAGASVVQTRANVLAIQRCGDPARIVYSRDSALAAITPGLVVWLTDGDTRLRGVCLPSGKPVDITAPANVAMITDLALSLHHLFVSGSGYRNRQLVWEADRPRCLDRAQRRGPSVTGSPLSWLTNAEGTYGAGPAGAISG